MTPFLRDDELAEMTRPLVQAGALRRYLRKIGVSFLVRPDGQPLVFRESFRSQPTTQTPNFAAVQKRKAQ